MLPNKSHWLHLCDLQIPTPCVARITKRWVNTQSPKSPPRWRSFVLVHPEEHLAERPSRVSTPCTDARACDFDIARTSKEEEGEGRISTSCSRCHCHPQHACGVVRGRALLVQDWQNLVNLCKLTPLLRCIIVKRTV